MFTIKLALLVGFTFYVEGIQMFNYREENVSFAGTAQGITLAGTLTLPQSTKSPAVILIAGYGKNDRNCTFLNKQPFKIIAESLGKKGIAVLRYDKRGVGKSTGDYNQATTEDFAADVRAAIHYLKSRTEIDHNKIGLIGLSEGGLIASMILADSKDVAFAVLLAPAVLSSVDDFIEMNGLQMKADGASATFMKNDAQMRKQVFHIVRQEPDAREAKRKLQTVVSEYLSQLTESERQEAEKIPFAFTQAKAEGMINVFNSVWYRYFLRCNPEDYLVKIKAPVLAIAGDRDWIANPDKIFPILDNAFKKGKNQDYTLLKLENINHMFQECKSGAIAECAALSESLSPKVVAIILDWIITKTK